MKLITLSLHLPILLMRSLIYRKSLYKLGGKQFLVSCLIFKLRMSNICLKDVWSILPKCEFIIIWNN